MANVALSTAMTDFTEVGEINVFMDASEVTLLEYLMWGKVQLGHQQVSGGFQQLKSADVIWPKMLRGCCLGHCEPMFDPMVWNVDGTRMLYRQHSELLRRLYVNNELFEGTYMVEGGAVSMRNIHCRSLPSPRRPTTSPPSTRSTSWTCRATPASRPSS